jgi:hypothetical protein
MTSAVAIKISATGVTQTVRSINNLKKSLMEVVSAQTKFTESSINVKNILNQQATVIENEIKFLNKEANSLKETINLKKQLLAVEERIASSRGRRTNKTSGISGTNDSSINAMSISAGFGKGFGKYALAHTAKSMFSALPGGEIVGGLAEAAVGAAIGGSMIPVLGALSAFGGVVALASAGLKAFSSFLISDVIKPHLSYDTKYVQLANRSAGGITAEEVKKAGKEATLKWNLDQEDAIKAMGIFGAKGNKGSWKDAPKALEFAAMESKARGTDISTIMNTLVGLKLPNESFEATRERYLNNQKLGDIYNLPVEELGSRAKSLKLISSRLKGNENQQSAMANAVLQELTPFTKSPEEAITSMRALINNITGKAKAHFGGKKAGVISMQEGVEVTDIPAAIEKLLAKGGTKQNLIGQGIKEVRAQKAVEALYTEYSEDVKKNEAKGLPIKEAEKAAAKEVADKFIELASITGTLEEEQKKAAEVMDTAGERFDHSLIVIKEALADTVMPEITKFAKSLSDPKNLEVIKQYLVELAQNLLLVSRVALAVAKFFGLIPEPQTGKASEKVHKGITQAEQDRDTQEALNPTPEQKTKRDKELKDLTLLNKKPPPNNFVELPKPSNEEPPNNFVELPKPSNEEPPNNFVELPKPSNEEPPNQTIPTWLIPPELRRPEQNTNVNTNADEKLNRVAGASDKASVAIDAFAAKLNNANIPTGGVGGSSPTGETGGAPPINRTEALPPGRP